LTDVTSLTVDPASNLYMANGSSVAKLDHNDNVVHTVADVDEPVAGMAFDARHNTLYAVNGHQISRVGDNGDHVPIAGTGKAGKAADGAKAMQSRFGDLDGLVVDGEGKLFVADRSNNVIDEITTDGVVHIYAGNGTKGFAGDGGPATSAEFDGPGAMCIDKDGNIYVADTANQRIRMIGHPRR
jgi:sugar lactone lactonase YvrE